MFKIGEFSKLSKVTVKALRHYDRIGLLRPAEIQQMVVQEQQRLTRVEALLRQIEQEGVMPTQEVVIKRVEPMRVASLRDVIPTFDAQGPL